MQIPVKNIWRGYCIPKPNHMVKARSPGGRSTRNLSLIETPPTTSLKKMWLWMKLPSQTESRIGKGLPVV